MLDCKLYSFVFQKKKKKKKKTLKTACRYDYVTLYAQSVDLRNAGIVLRKPWIHGLWYNPPCMDWPRNPGIARAQSIDQDNPGIARAQSIDQDNPGVARAQSISRSEL